jgi:ribosomal protein L27
VSAEGFFIHARHVQSFAGAGVEEGIDVDLFMIIDGIVAIMWHHVS